MALPKPTMLELQIMEALWTHGPCSVRKIQESFPARKVLRRTRKIVTDAIEFQGTRIPQFALRATIASRVGGACDIKTLRRGSQSFNTGRFSDVLLETEPGPRGVNVRFVVVQRPLIQSIDYHGDDAVTLPEILERFKPRKVQLRAQTLLR